MFIVVVVEVVEVVVVVVEVEELVELVVVVGLLLCLAGVCSPQFKQGGSNGSCIINGSAANAFTASVMFNSFQLRNWLIYSFARAKPRRRFPLFSEDFAAELAARTKQSPRWWWWWQWWQWCGGGVAVVVFLRKMLN